MSSGVVPAQALVQSVSGRRLVSGLTREEVVAVSAELEAGTLCALVDQDAGGIVAVMAPAAQGLVMAGLALLERAPEVLERVDGCLDRLEGQARSTRKGAAALQGERRWEELVEEVHEAIAAVRKELGDLECAGGGPS